MNRRLAAGLVGLGLAAKLVLLAVLVSGGGTPGLYLDSATYIGPAKALLETGRYATGPEPGAGPELVRTPGFPALLALVFALFGERLWVVSALGALFAAATALAVLFLLAGPFGERAAAWAAVLLTFEPGSFFRSFDVLSETVFTLLLVLGLAALVACVRPGALRPAPALLGGGALALATLVRPILVHLLPLLALLLLAVALRRRGTVRERAAVVGAFLLVPALLVGGWMARNARVGGAFSLAPLTGHQLLHRRAAAVVARVDGIPLTRAQERLGIREAYFRFRGPGSEAELFGGRTYRELFPGTADLGLFELDRRWRREAMEIFRAHPAATAAETARAGLLLILSPPSLILSVRFGLVRPEADLGRLYDEQQVEALARSLARRHPALFAVSALLVALLGALALLAAVGAVRCWRAGPRAAHAVLLVALGYL
ncbi:MAG TPA: glycosyltransferase family 39 protein, partial [Thermoanaerobaculia bacterium]|nr:glycosyltransferase family 39 protein [Thermoanaerobaculia bacterium]